MFEKLTSSGQIAIDAGTGSSFASVGFFPRVVVTNTTLTDGNALVVPESLEVSSGIQLEIGAGSELEITGAPNATLSFLEVSMDNDVLGEVPPTRTFGTAPWGDIDWYVANTGNTPPLTVGASAHSKYNGGWILNSFRWDYGGTTATPGTTSGNIARTTVAADDIANGVEAADLVLARIVAPASIVNGLGFQFKVPVTMQRKVLRMYIGANGCDLTVTGTFSNGAVTKSQFFRNCFAIGAIPQWMAKLDYWGSSCDMTVNVKSSGATANLSEVWCVAVWISTS